MIEEEYFYREGKIIKKSNNRSCGYFDGRYHRFKYKGKLYLTHRVIWYLYYGEWPLFQIDHIDRDTKNNKVENLRDVSARVNIQNRSDFNYGTDFHKGTKRWRARIKVNGIVEELGYFATEEQSQDAYRNREKELANYGF